jgi:pimeloyl-ACP methyl ester carboxylesterase
MKYLFKFAFLAFCLAVSGCSSSVALRQRNAEHLAKINGFEKKLVRGGDFWITTYQRINNSYSPYVFYIEGDGLAFTRYSISEDPTPVNPVAFKLAALDKRPNVVYVARLCQYTPYELNPKCNKSYWTNQRMSQETVFAINQVIKKVGNDAQYSLVGYSGGGGIAMLIAAQDKMVKNVITVAGNLDHVSFNRHHNTPPMIGSLNPIDYVSKTRKIPQLHVSGGQDNIVPALIADQYVRASNSNCVHQEIITDARHNSWDKVWEYILNIPLGCYNN